MADGRADKTDINAFLGRPKRSWLVRMRLWVLLALAAVAFLALAPLLLGRPKPEAGYVTADVVEGNLAVTVTATGNLAPTRQIDIGSELSGIVESVFVEVNDRVETGQLLAQIDISRLNDTVTRSRASLSSSEASVGQAEATLQEAQAQLARLEEVARLSGGRTPSKTELSAQVAVAARAAAALNSARANVVAARAQLSSDQTQVGKAAIRSPVSGVVLKRSIDPGQTVQAAFNTPSLFIIAESLSRMKLEVAVDEADVGRVREGQEATFTVDAYPGRTFPATVSRVNLGARNLVGGSSGSQSSASNVVSYLAYLQLSNDDLSLRPGMTATATLRAESVSDALLVANGALRFQPDEKRVGSGSRGLSFGPPGSAANKVEQQRGIGEGSVQTVYVLQADGVLKSIQVTTGPSDGRLTVVTSNELSAGMAVVTGQKAVVK